MIQWLLNKLMNRPRLEDIRFWRAIGVLIVFAAVGALWLMVANLK